MKTHCAIRLAEQDDLAALEPLFKDMYTHFQRANGITRLSDGGFDRWCANYQRSRSISRVVYIAYQDQKIAGFIEGQIRIQAQSVNPEKSGHTAHLYVAPVFRRAGLAAKLYATLSEWFGEKAVQAETLEVVYNNDGADTFWLSRGFRPAFINYSKTNRTK